MMPCGLARVARAELDSWASAVDRTLPHGRGSESESRGSESGTIHPTVFDSSDGIRSFAQAGGYSPRVAKSADGKLWFPIFDGVSVIDPGHLPFNKLPPPVQVEQVISDRKTYAAGAKLPAPAPVFPRYIEPPGAAAGQATQ